MCSYEETVECTVNVAEEIEDVFPAMSWTLLNTFRYICLRGLKLEA